MDGTRNTNALLVVCMAVSLLAIVVSGYSVIADDPEPEPQYDEVRYTIFLGMSDKPPEYVQSVEDRMIQLITATGNGYTLEHETGGYVVDGQVFKDDITLVFLVIAAEYDQITDILDKIMDEYSIPAVYMERENVSSGFYTGD